MVSTSGSSSGQNQGALHSTGISKGRKKVKNFRFVSKNSMERFLERKRETS
ncbi:hypothetical protein LEP1GSC005_3893 [Leptospira santarosai str. ST188]|nr:hypothetical protein LEP1GSC005_3893 [Leptospira santarosai str. ST188]